MSNVPQTILGLLAFLTLAPLTASAHQPRIVEGGPVQIEQPEVSQAFYGELGGAPDEFLVKSVRPFRLYVGILVPAVPEARKDISVKIHRALDGGSETVALLDGDGAQWTPFFEEFARDDYFWGPEYKAEDSKKWVMPRGRPVPAGNYVLTVFSPSNHGKYSLAVGDLEEFPVSEMIHAAVTIPRIKAWFFGKPPIQILLSPYGWGLVLALYVLAFTGGFFLRALVGRFGAKAGWGLPSGFGSAGRLVGAGLGLSLLAWAVATIWSPVLILLSGFCFFHASFGLRRRPGP